MTVIFMIIFYVFFFLFALFVVFWQASLIFAQILGAPSVYSNSEAIFQALKLAELKKGGLIIDLGCGDARSLIIAAKKFGAHGIGVERSPFCFLKSKLNVLLAHESRNITILFGDFKVAEKYLKKADVIYLYLLNSVLKNIESWLFENISAKTKVVSLAFEFSDHKPKETSETKNLGRITKLRLYVKR